jgi:thiamine pyrophosphate-dependent acetolactate synthase large subunit-like protein
MADTASTVVTGAQSVVSSLEQLYVGLAFGLPGVHNLAVCRTLSTSSIRLVGVRHEQTAVYAADGYARATGRLGVALVTTRGVSSVDIDRASSLLAGAERPLIWAGGGAIRSRAGQLVGELARAEPHMIVVRAALAPPPTTSPRWYRKA